MTSVLQRQKLLGLIHRACVDGARLNVACRQIGLSCRSVPRWQRAEAVQGDRRQSGQQRQVCPPCWRRPKIDHVNGLVPTQI